MRDLRLFYLTHDIKEALSGTLLTPEEKQARKACFTAIFRNGESRYVAGAEAEALAKAELGVLYERSIKS